MLPNETYIVRLYHHNGEVQEIETCTLQDGEQVYHTFTGEPYYKGVALLRYNWNTRTGEVVMC